MEGDPVKRLMWSGLLAGIGALATAVWRRLFDEDPPE
jgi:hypothetical protein